MEIKYRILLFVFPILVGLGSLLIWQSWNLVKTRLVFCDVGQGDAILITAGLKQVLVDGGPGTKVLDCLARKMPFWDRTLELVVLTHPQRDHLEGLVEVLARYKVKMIATTGVKNETALFDAWQKALDLEKAKIYEPKAGDRLKVDQFDIDVLWPTEVVGDSWQGQTPQDLNESSIVARLAFGQYCAYLTGDIPKEIFQGLIDKPCQILKVAHHGSKTGTNEEVLEAARPQVAVIQVGKNSFGHPYQEVLEILKSRGIKVYRNDINGIIEVIAEEGVFRVDTQR